MNAERLLTIIDKLLLAETTYPIGAQLDKLVGALTNLSSSPGDQNFQSIVSDELIQLSTMVDVNFYPQLDPSDIDEFRDVRALEYFSPSLITTIRVQLSENAMTPAVAVEAITKIQKARAAYMATLATTRKSLIALGIHRYEIRAGEAELGILLPRDLFKNELGGLAKELGALDRTMGVFSEVAVGSAVQIEIQQISTSDPRFFLLLDPKVVGTVVVAITWLLNTWKQALEIKKLRNETKSAGFSDEELKVFDVRIEKIIDASIRDHSAKLLENSTADEGRKHELSNGLDMALRGLLARIERGMTVEVNFLSSDLDQEREQAGGDVSEEQLTGAMLNKRPFAAMSAASKKLSFPLPVGEPLVALPRTEPTSPS